MKAMIMIGIVMGIMLLAGCEGAYRGGTTQKDSCLGMSLAEAEQITKDACGNLKAGGMEVCNENTRTWWIDVDLEMDGCNPACVVNVDTKEAEVNWRCTGLNPSSDEEPGENVMACGEDSDCIPKPDECHARTCINKDFKDNYEEVEICTMMFDPEAAYGPEDCVCVDNVCVDKNLN